MKPTIGRSALALGFLLRFHSPDASAFRRMAPPQSLASLVRLSTYLMVASILASLDCGIAYTDDGAWHQFRGPTGQGLATVELPTRLLDPNNQVWTVATTGTGWSSPVIADGQLWFTTAVTEKATAEALQARLATLQFAEIKTFAGSVEFHALCLDASSGKMVHDIVLTRTTEPEPINPMNSYASPTPTIVDGKVICHFGNYGTWCLDARSGDTLWSTKQVVDHSVGPGSSPIVIGNKVILVCDGTDQQFVAAVDLENGREVWKTPRPPLRATNVEFKKAYSTPLPIEVNGSAMLVIPGAQWTVAYDPQTGSELWRVDCGNGFSTTPMAVYDAGLVIISTGYMRPEFVAIRPDGKGDVTDTHIAWRNGRGAPTMPSAIARDGRMYSISDAGILTVFNAKTGEEINRARIGGNFSASPILSASHLYVASREGVVTVLKADDSLATVAANDFECPIMASPAVIGKDLVIRTEKGIVRISSK